MTTRIKKIITASLLILAPIIFVNSCYAYLTYYGEENDGFLWGLWHGVSSFIKLPASVVAPQNIHVYNLNNNGFVYNLGFFIAAICVFRLMIPFLISAWI